ncbi:hypothetical protein FACS1894105_07010 [Clostridia bacterium]|nr:hypothetical protein FACS1894105_07010 [Clostridia bacterium]
MVLHIDLFVISMDVMLDFYVGKLGMAKIDDQIITGDLVRFISRGNYDAYRLVLLKVAATGAMIELMEYVTTNKPQAKQESINPITIALLTPCLEKKINELSEKDVLPVSSIFEVELKNAGKSKIIFYSDPENNLIEYLQVT